MVEEDTWVRPPVVLGGVNPEHFRPVEVAKEYDLLCVGERRAWKGQGIIDLAAELAGVQAERYSTKDLAQSAMAEGRGNSTAPVPLSAAGGASASRGLEAFARSLPLITTDNAGAGTVPHVAEAFLPGPSSTPLMFCHHATLILDVVQHPS